MLTPSRVVVREVTSDVSLRRDGFGICLAVLDGTEFGDGARWVACILLAVGVLAQSGGMFLHMAIGKPGAWSRANTLTTAGAVALAAGMLTTAYGVIIT